MLAVSMVIVGKRRQILLIALVALVIGCGARTELVVESCGDVGSRACSNVCGDGMQTCVDGSWSSCDVALARVVCTTMCGEGTALCIDGAEGTCDVSPVERVCESVCEEGTETCADGFWGACTAREPLAVAQLAVRIRDFSRNHLDFENTGGVDRGIVESRLGPDDKPVYASAAETRTTHGRALFDQWYRDTPGINRPIDLELEFRPRGGSLFVYEDLSFFPIDGDGFGNEGFEHNFHFTLEATASFQYVGGETFRFYGEDDLWLFINRRLAMDVGGTHAQEEANLDLDERAADLGLVPGQRYPLHIFFAERHTDGSSFSVETTIVGDYRCD